MEPREIIKRVREIREELASFWQANKGRLEEGAGKSDFKRAVSVTVGKLFGVLDSWPGDMEGHFTIVRAIERLKGDVLCFLEDAAGKEEMISQRMDRALAHLEDAAARVAGLAVAR